MSLNSISSGPSTTSSAIFHPLSLSRSLNVLSIVLVLFISFCLRVCTVCIYSFCKASLSTKQSAVKKQSIIIIIMRRRERGGEWWPIYSFNVFQRWLKANRNTPVTVADSSKRSNKEGWKNPLFEDWYDQYFNIQAVTQQLEDCST